MRSMVRNSWINGCSEVSRSAVGPKKITLPSCRNTVLSATLRISARSCVTTTAVSLSVSFRRSIRSEETHDVAQRHGFSHAAAADNGYGFSRIHVKIGIDQDRVVEGLVDVAELDVVRELFSHSVQLRRCWSHS